MTILLGPPSMGWAWDAEEGRPPNPHCLSGLCRGLSDPHCLAPQLLSGGEALVLFWEPPASAGCRSSNTLHSLGESGSWGPAGVWKGPEAKVVEAHLISFHIISRFHFTLSFHVFSQFPFIFLILCFWQFPFEKNCGNDSICQDDLSITFSFMR